MSGDRMSEIKARQRDLDALREHHERRVAQIWREQAELAKEAEAIVLEAMNNKNREVGQ